MDEYSTPELRKLLKRYYRDLDLAFERKRDYPVFPEKCRGMRCGARTKRAGTPCKLRSIFDKGRCKFHGSRKQYIYAFIQKKKKPLFDKNGLNLFNLTFSNILDEV